MASLPLHVSTVIVLNLNDLFFKSPNEIDLNRLILHPDPLLTAQRSFLCPPNKTFVVTLYFYFYIVQRSGDAC